MAGILDSKSRIIDAILTTEGRRQIAEGTFSISYATFTDEGVSYIPDTVDGHEDPAGKIYFEACNLPQDQITFEANDEGKLVPFRNQDIKLATPGGNVSSSYAEGTIANGRLVVYKHYHGRRVKTSFIYGNPADNHKGFTYTDSSGLSGSILINSSVAAGSIVAAAPIGGSPFVAFVGTRGSLGPAEFAQAISGAIGKLATFGGPSVLTEAINDSVYMDVGETFLGTKIFATGTLSAPLLIEEGATGGRVLVDELENASFASQIQGILTSSFDNFADLQTLSTIDRLFLDDKFELTSDSEELTFDLSKISSKMLSVLKEHPPSLDMIDSIFNDDKMSHLENFMYLPPIVKTSDSLVPDKTKIENLTPYLLGDYPSWGDNEKKLTYEKLSVQLNDFKDLRSTVRFKNEKTSRNNRIIGQFFEVSDKVVNKLDVVDFGAISNESKGSTPDTRHVFFVGKTFLDNRGTVCFVNMFTLIFSKDDEEKGD